MLSLHHLWTFARRRDAMGEAARTDAALERLKQASSTLQSALRIDFDLYDSDFGQLASFRTEAKFPSPLMDALDLQAYFADTLAAMQEREGDAIYVHEVPAFCVVCYDFRVVAGAGDVYYVSVGPFLQLPYSKKLVAQVMAGLKIPASAQPVLEAYYSRLSYYAENVNSTLSVIYSLLTGQTVLSGLPLCTGARAVGQARGGLGPFEAVTSKNSEVLLDYREVLARTAAIRRGDHKAAMASVSAGSQDWSIVRPGASPLRTAKNLHYSSNGINRMAAVEGGADPIQVHRTSESFCIKLESLQNEDDMLRLEREAIKTYCDLVVEGRMRQYAPLAQKAIRQLYACYDTPLTLAKVAGAIHCSPSHLSRTFQRETGMTMGEYLTRLRVEFAASMLKSGDRPVTEVALAVGFSSYSKFSVAFKRQMGCSASAYRNG